MSQTYSLLHPQAVQARWHEIRDLLDRAVAHGRGELQVDDLLALVLSGGMGVLVLEEEGEIIAATAFEVIRYPRRAVLNFAYTGGRGSAGIVRNIDVLYDVARRMGADTLSCLCRPAVARHIRRMLPQAEQAYVVVEMRVPAQETMQ